VIVSHGCSSTNSPRYCSLLYEGSVLGCLGLKSWPDWASAFPNIRPKRHRIAKHLPNLLRIQYQCSGSAILAYFQDHLMVHEAEQH